MPLDGTILGTVAAQQMAALERDYGEVDARIGAVMTIVEVLRPMGTDEEGNTQFGSDVRSRHNIGDPYRAIGIIKAAEHNITATTFGDTQIEE